MIDALHAVRVSSGEEDAIRDLVRVREDLRGDLMRARHPLSKLLFCHDVRSQDTTSGVASRTTARCQGSRRVTDLTLSIDRSKERTAHDRSILIGYHRRRCAQVRR
jgi:hypothetical protein